MKRFVEGRDRGQSTLFPECLGDWIDENNPVRVIDAFVDAVDLGALGFDGVEPADTGRPAYHPSTLLKLYIPRSRPDTHPRSFSGPSPIIPFYTPKAHFETCAATLKRRYRLTLRLCGRRIIETLSS